MPFLLCKKAPLPKKPPFNKGGGFGFAKTGGILLKLPAEFNGMGFSPHPSRLYYLWRATFPQGKAERLDLTGWDYNPSVICFANATSLYTRETFINCSLLQIP